MATVDVRICTYTDMLPLLTEYEQQMDAVAERAYHLFEGRGAKHGRDLDDWLTAQHQIICLPQAQPSEEAGQFRVLTSLCGFHHDHLEVIVSPHDMLIRAQSPGPSQRRRTTEQPQSSNGIFCLKAMAHYRFRAAVDPRRITADFEVGTLQVIIPKVPSTEKDTFGGAL